MKPVFADSFFYLAILNEKDVRHTAALRLAKELRRRVVVTEFVLMEVGNSVSTSPVGRELFVRLVSDLRANPNVTVVPATSELFDRGLALYASRADKT
jgi:predicted nucleic acid-binding protein